MEDTVIPFAADYLDRLQANVDDLLATIAGLPQAALDWQPGLEENSLAVLLAHSAGATRYWIGDVVGQDPSQRDRPAEFDTTGVPAADLEQRWQAVLAHSHDVLAALTPEMLAEERLSPRDGKEYRVGWCLLHALEHVALHLGHAQMTRQAWDLAQQA
jgi:hypothetical protein